MAVEATTRFVREVDRPVGDGKPADPVDLGPLLGVWRNANHRTWGITRIHLTQREGIVRAHVWAADERAGGSRDWGEESLDGLYTDGLASNRVCGFRVTFDLGHAHTQIQVNMLHSVAVCAAVTTFVDGSGRSNYLSREFLHRRGD